METDAFVTYMEERLSAELDRESILEMTNKAQNEILSNANGLTRIKPDPYLHTGMTAGAGAASGNDSGNYSFIMGSAIVTTTPTAGYLLITEGGTTDKLKYVSYSGSTFTLADDVSLPRSYTDSASVTIDNFQIIASGALFNSIANSRTSQYDIKKVSRIYAYLSRTSNFRAYGRGHGNNLINSYNPEWINNSSSERIKIPFTRKPSRKWDSNDEEIVLWRENDPGVTTETYICEAYEWADQLTNEDVDITIPDEYQPTLLKFAILKDVEYTEYGRNNVPQSEYDKYLKKFLTDYPAKDRLRPARTLPRF